MKEEYLQSGEERIVLPDTDASGFLKIKQELLSS